MVFPWQKRKVPPELAERVPPGQVLTDKFPVLHFGRVPDYGDLLGWDFRVWGKVDRPLRWTYEELRSQDVTRQVCDRAGQVDCNYNDYFHPNPPSNSAAVGIVIRSGMGS